MYNLCVILGLLQYLTILSTKNTTFPLTPWHIVFHYLLVFLDLVPNYHTSIHTLLSSPSWFSVVRINGSAPFLPSPLPPLSLSG